MPRVSTVPLETIMTTQLTETAESAHPIDNSDAMC